MAIFEKWSAMRREIIRSALGHKAEQCQTLLDYLSPSLLRELAALTRVRCCRKYLTPSAIKFKKIRSRNCDEQRTTELRIIGFKQEAQVRIMFALHRRSPSLATRFGIVVLVVTLACGLASQTAKAQFRIGIGVGGIGGAIAGPPRDDSYRRQQYQSQQYQRYQRPTEGPSTKKTAKARNQKPTKEDTKIAKESPPKAKPPEPVASAPPTAPLTAGPPPTADNFGD
jgi:hypothetical protein